MTDAQRRELERRLRVGSSLFDDARWLTSGLRAGTLLEADVRLAAQVGHQPSRWVLASGTEPLDLERWAPDEWRDAFAPGLQTWARTLGRGRPELAPRAALAAARRAAYAPRFEGPDPVVEAALEALGRYFGSKTSPNSSALEQLARGYVMEDASYSLLQAHELIRGLHLGERARSESGPQWIAWDRLLEPFGTPHGDDAGLATLAVWTLVPSDRPSAPAEDGLLLTASFAAHALASPRAMVEAVLDAVLLDLLPDQRQPRA